MKICLVVHDLRARDGWSRYASDLGRALSERGHDVSALVHEQTDAPWCRQSAMLRPPLHCLSLLGILAQYWRTYRALAALKPDVVHVIDEPYALLIGLLPKTWRFILTLHGSYAVIPFRSGFIARMLSKYAFRKTDRILSVSAYTKNRLKKDEPAFFVEANLETKITVVPNAIRLAPASAVGEQSVHTPKRILGVGAVKNRKGYLQSVRALAAFKKLSPLPFRYDIVGSLGDEVYVDELKREIAHLGLQNEVTIRGSVAEEELRTLYRETDLFLMLSLEDGPYFEGFVLAFLEAAAHGIPCIGPRTGGCPEAIDEGKSGYVCEPGDYDNVAAAMKKILEGRSISPTACRQWAEAHDIRKAAENIETIYLS